MKIIRWIILFVAFGFATMILLNMPDFIKNNSQYSALAAIFLFVPLVFGFAKIFK